jgi:hypothetical protein
LPKEINANRFFRGSHCTDKKENQIFLIYKEIQNGAVAKSYMTKGSSVLIYGEIFANFLIYIGKNWILPKEINANRFF